MYREYINVVDTRRNKKPSQYDRDRLVRMIHIIVVLRSPDEKGQDDIISNNFSDHTPHNMTWYLNFNYKNHIIYFSGWHLILAERVYDFQLLY